MIYFIKQVIGNRIKHNDFQKFKTIGSFGREIYIGIRTLDDPFQEQ